MNRISMVSIVGILVVLWLAFLSTFTVSEHEVAIKFRLGEFERADYMPGLHFKIPLINKVRKFDARVVTLDMEPSRFLTKEKKNLIVDAFVKWKIDDVTAYYRTTGGDETRANQRLSQLVVEGLRNRFGMLEVKDAISGERAQLTDLFAAQAKQFGISVVDVRIKRIELPPEVSTSVYQRMEAERARAAKDLRSKGAEEAEGIRAKADRERIVELANAYQEAEQLRGDGDAEASRIYAEAFGKNEEFYRLYRSLDAYKNVFNDEKNVLVLDPGSEFFRYFKNEQGR